jgi:hypothetical protein
MIIYMENTLNYLVESKGIEFVQNLLKSGEVKTIIRKEEKINYLIIKENGEK